MAGWRGSGQTLGHLVPDERVLAIGGLAGKVVRIALDQGFARAQEAVAEEELGRLARCLAEELGMAGIHRH